MLTGYRQHGEIAVCTQHDYEPAIQGMVRRYPPVTLADLQLAAKIASQIAAIEAEMAAGTSYCEHSGDPDQPFQAIPITHSNRSDQCGAGVREGAVGCIS
jgi:hypothetical protein